MNDLDDDIAKLICYCGHSMNIFENEYSESMCQGCFEYFDYDKYVGCNQQNCCYGKTAGPSYILCNDCVIYLKNENQEESKEKDRFMKRMIDTNNIIS